MAVEGLTEHYVYILRCSDGSLYVGSAHDVAKRVSAHNAGNGAAYTRLRRPVTLVHVERHENQVVAMRRERQVKRWSRAKKDALIADNSALLHELARRRGN